MRFLPASRSRRRIAGLAVAGVIGAGLAGLLAQAGVLAGLERETVSARFAVRHAPKPNDIVVVGIDDSTFNELRRQWPFPRTLHAHVVDRLHAAGAREIVYDVQFTEPTRPAEDLALFRAIGRAGGAVLATSEVDAHGRTNVLGGDANLAEVHARAAAATLSNVAGGTVTRYPYAVTGLKSIAVAAAERAIGRPLPRSRFPDGTAWIDYRGGPGSVQTVPFSAVLRGRVPARLFRGKIVVVGATAPTLQDVHSTPVGGAGLMAGPEVQANAIWTALHGNPLRDAPAWWAVAAVLLAAFTAPLMALRFGALRALVAAVAAATAYLVAAQIAFDSGVIVSVASPVASFGLGATGMLVASYLTASGETRRLVWVVRRRSEQLRDAQLEIVQRLTQAAESRDQDTGQHIERIGYMCEQLGLRAGLKPSEARMLRHASAMHDVGKIAIPDRLLLKPGPLDSAEREIMKSHATKGAEILRGSDSPLIQMAETIARTHHERWDGSGYPAGLRGEEIPLVGRICAVCDVFDALTHKRPYKEAWSVPDALREIERGAGSHFDPALAAAFVELAPRLERDLAPSIGDALDLESLPSLAELPV